MPDQFTFGGEIVWRPTPEHIERAHLTAFMRQHGIKDFDELMRRSTSDVPWFTDAILKYLIFNSTNRIRRSWTCPMAFNCRSGAWMGK